MTDKIEGTYVSDSAYQADDMPPLSANRPSVEPAAPGDAMQLSLGSEWMVSAARDDWYYQKGARRTRRLSVVWSRRPVQQRASQDRR
jgi:hypothetical protein